ncbi:response regulator transcription factor [Rhizobacter sp. Root1221]|uniref:response regulator n=1 Tax=Rhizobacter sp. Root1221 TaxID=1736433 RepID=UPI0009E9A5FE|nr:response regulator transcription factor [Rhizobacter sp. Root1221]
MTIRIVLADDHRMMRDGLSALLNKDSGFDVVGVAEDGLGAIRLARELLPDVLVTDLAMPGMNGIEAIRRVRAETPSVHVLCLSVHTEDRMVLAGIDAGAAGYVLKDSSFEDLALAIRKVMARQIYLSPGLVGVFVEGYRTRGSAVVGSAFSQLTPREREIVQLFSEGHSTGQIAEQLHLSAKTVATHRENVLHKLRIESIAELTRYAIREGLSSLEAPCRNTLAATSTSKSAKLGKGVSP